MKIEYDGQVYEFSIQDMTVDECEAIEKYCGVRGLGEWSNQVAVANTKAYQALWWVMRRQAGEDAGPIARKDAGFRPIAMHEAYSAAQEAEAKEKARKEAEAAEAEDPTRLSPVLSSPAPSAGTTTILATAAATPSLPG